MPSINGRSRWKPCCRRSDVGGLLSSLPPRPIPPHPVPTHPVSLSVLSPAELLTLLQHPAKRHGPLVIDVRSAVRFRRGHIPGSHHLASGLLLSSELPDDDLVLIAEDERGAREIGEALRHRGFHRQIRHLQGGLEAWRQAGHTLQPSPPADCARPAAFPVAAAVASAGLASGILIVQRTSAPWIGAAWALLVAPLLLVLRSVRPGQRLLRRRPA